MQDKSSTYYLIILTLMLITTACDKIEDPHPPTLGFDLSLFPGEPEDYPYPDFQASTNTLRNVLLEDYTGHKCVPCVGAAVTAENIENANDGRVHVVGIHASPSGNFQQVDLEHPTDFTTEAGNTYVIEMDGVDFNPVGTTSRVLDDQSFGTPRIWQFESFWAQNVNEVLDSELDADLQVTINYYEETNAVFVHSRADFLNDKNGTYNLVHYLIRKQVESPQSTPSGIDEEYEHHNVLTENIGGTWGINIASGSISAGFFAEHQLSYPLTPESEDQTFAADNLAVVSYLINRDTYEILQVVETELLP